MALIQNCEYPPLGIELLLNQALSEFSTKLLAKILVDRLRQEVLVEK